MLDQLRGELKSSTLIIGRDRVLKAMRKGDLKRVYLAKNVDDQTREAIEHYARLAQVELNLLEIPNTELGVVCKKPYSIMVLGVV